MSLDSASITECMTVGLRRSWKCYFHCLTISSVEGSRIPLPLYRVWVECHFTLLIFLMFYENLFEASQKSYSMVSPNSSHTCVFASATARLALHWEHLSAAIGVSQANQPQQVSFFTSSVHYLVLRLPPQKAPPTLKPQLLQPSQQWRCGTWHTQTQCPQSPWGICQMFPVHHHYMCGYANAVQQIALI